ncbi:hypothetical protein HQQ81_19805 [Microbacteriaceae bacterium VKM Ac-2854]|nr:hypothetical protein [Microbacteriaceae bacterium VKM Ac-2854]
MDNNSIPAVTNDAVTSRGRRTLIKGAAWTLPVVAAATAAPAAVASDPTTPVCPTCIKPGVLGAITTQAVVLGNTGALLFAGALGLDSTSCNLSLFQPLYTSIVTAATLTMSDNTTHTGVGLGSGTGTFGQLGALPGSFLFNNIHFPNGVYLANSNPVRPTKITVNLTIALIGLPSLITIQCPVSLTWDLNVFGVGTVIFGAGTINYTGVATPVV